ncbi:MAG: glycerol-3-phosphate 1-O-acyltransferase PlsY, partial [Pacificimonas sp.]
MPTDIFFTPWTWLVIGYLVGSIPFGLLLTKIAGKGDVRAVGSGNIGTTNVLRAGGKGLAVATLFLDIGKGALAVWLGGQHAMGGDILGGMGAFLGHCFPIWLAFKGGKGVATMLGVAAALNPLAGLVAAVTWIGVALIFRFSSLGGIVASVAAPIVPALEGRWDAALLLAGIAMLVIARHEANIRRLMAGTEPKIGQKDAPAAGPADA